jgi:hypothetical protein
LSTLDRFLWVIGLVGHIVLVAVLWRKRRAQRFPIFTTLITFYLVRTLALFFTMHYCGIKSNAYFYSYWTLGIGDVFLQLLVLYELALQIFRPTGRWAVDVRGSFLWLVGASVLLATGLTWLAAPATRSFKQVVFIRGNFFSSVLMSELFVGMVVLSVTSGLPWRTHVARIAQGLGVCAIVGILIEALQSYFGLVRGSEVYQALSQVQISTYLLTLLYWIITLGRDAPEPRPLPDQLNRQLLHLHQRSGTALGYIRVWRRS